MKISINELIKNPELIEQDRCKFFYDWFCKESSLERRAKSFLPKLKFLIKEELIDGDKLYVWFKNNCPMAGTLYDDMRFSTIDEKDNDFIGGVCPKSGHEVELKCEAWYFEGKTRELASIEYINWVDFKKAVKENRNGIKETLKEGWKI